MIRLPTNGQADHPHGVAYGYLLLHRRNQSVVPLVRMADVAAIRRTLVAETFLILRQFFGHPGRDVLGQRPIGILDGLHEVLSYRRR